MYLFMVSLLNLNPSGVEIILENAKNTFTFYLFRADMVLVFDIRP